MKKLKVLFVCIHNSARSQMAEAFLKKYGGEKFDVKSAGLEPGVLNPLVVRVMKEEGIDISGNGTKSVFEMFKNGELFKYVITVCDATKAEKCPIFPGVNKRLHWGFDDPSSLEGTEEEKIVRIRLIKEEIKQKIQHWIKEMEGE
ncbi:arsenate reductase ArsC [Candidatus Magnetomonas plexicatena]|uniref:arsenate reductase ArsC n=1 Tax=Candidatus Magnetomonas plexicatena TaxID=2552947 RepID=UPI001C7624AB|nr:arsenate reductase ArsC [Nitrospirales bacterium LBB_01]